MKTLFRIFFTVALMLCSYTVPAQVNISDSGVKVTVNDIPSANKLFSLKQEKIEIRQANFDSAVYIEKPGYPRIDFSKFDNNNQGRINKSYKAVILENKYIKLTLIPSKGKPYSMVYKVTGHEEFYIPYTAQILKSQNLGWWFILGGVEYTLPNDEHGDTWAADWKWEIIENSSAKKTIRMSVDELRHGLKETIDISIFPDKTYYEAAITIKNTTDSTVHFQHWINPMWVPGGRPEGITPNTEFIMPTKEIYATERTFNKWMLNFSPDGNRLQSFENSPMRFNKGWTNYGDLLAWKLEHGFYSAFCHEENEGIVRVFPVEMNPGCNIWTWGSLPPEATRKRFYGNESSNGYVEMWGGITHGFDKYYVLAPGKSISWSEYMYPYINTKGLHFANNDFAVTFFKTSKDDYEVNLCPSGELKGIELRVISEKSKKVYLIADLKSVFPSKDKSGFVFKSEEKDIQLIISKDGKEVIRLSPKEPVILN